MKVIDILNMRANGEDVPNFKLDGYTFKADNRYGYITDNEEDSLIESICTDFSNLNAEVEIIEEEKKIPEKLEYYDDSIAWVIDDVGQLSDVDKVIIDKLNNVIDYLKSKGE